MASPPSQTRPLGAEPIVDYVRNRSQVARPPTYHRDSTSTAIAHIGVGNFHRAHQAMYLDRLMTLGMADQWAICGIGLLPSDVRMREVMRRQQCLYTLVERHPDGREDAKIIASIAQYLYTPEELDACVSKLADPGTRIVSLTITEGGYDLPELPDRTWADEEVPDGPISVFHLMTLAARARRTRQAPGFTVLSCDNIPLNGHVARSAFLRFADAADPRTARWMADNVSFPSTMVDRITPVTTSADIQHVEDAFGVIDDWPVCSEAFTQWVVEDNFVAGRPPLEHAGVQMVSDVQPYELMKLRLLNGGHQAVAYFALLQGYTHVHEAMGDAGVAAFLQTYLAEAAATLPPIPGIDVAAYCRSVAERFGNAHVRDTNARLAQNASDRIPKFVLPTVRERLRRGEDAGAGASVVAAWACFCHAVASGATPAAVSDPRADVLLAAARALPEDPLAFLRIEPVFGDLAQHHAFAAAYTATVSLLLTTQVGAVLESITR